MHPTGSIMQMNAMRLEISLDSLLTSLLRIGVIDRTAQIISKIPGNIPPGPGIHFFLSLLSLIPS
jgi:hypothetical protein